MALHPVETAFVTREEGPVGVARSCKLCKFYHFRKKPISGGLMSVSIGRGNGMREGNKQRGILIRHIKTEHPKEYAAVMQTRKT